MTTTMQWTIQSRQIVLTQDEEAFFADKTDEYIVDIARYLQQVRQNVTTMKTAAESKGAMLKEGKCFPTYEDPLDDTPIRVGCRLLAEFVSRHVTDKNSRLIDVGAGTGYVAVEVKKLGFTNIDCLEPCQSMIDKQPKGLFGNVYKDVISCAKPSTIEAGSYDCAMLSGVVFSGHIEVEDIPELLRIIKPGGHVIFTIPDYWSKHKEFGVRMAVILQSELEKGHVDSVAMGRIAYVYRVEDATTYVLKKSFVIEHNNNDYINNVI